MTDKAPSPIFVHTYDFLQWLVPCTLGFPKAQRGVMARQLQTQAFTLHETLVDAAMLGAPLDHLGQADAALAKLRTYLRLSRDLRLISPDQHEHTARFMAEIGRLLGGWVKKERQMAGLAR